MIFHRSLVHPVFLFAIPVMPGRHGSNQMTGFRNCWYWCVRHKLKLEGEINGKGDDMLRSQAVRLLRYLLQQNRAVSIHQIASVHNLNVRSVQQYLRELEEWFEETGWNVSLERMSRTGVLLRIDEREKESILHLIHSEDPHLKVYQPEERRRLILFELFRREEPLLVKELVIDFRVSESTILRDLNRLQEWVEIRGLKMIRRPNFGIQLTGKEIQWRLALFELIKEYLTAMTGLRLEELLVQFQYKSRFRYAYFHSLNWLMPEEGFHRLQHLLLHVLFAQKLRLTDHAMASLMVHTAITVHRVKQGKSALMEHDQFAYIRGQPAYSIARFISEQLRRETGVALPDEEIAYIGMHLLGSTFTEPDRNGPGPDSTDLDKIVGRLVSTLEWFTQLDLRQDRQFIAGLCAHIKPMVERLRFGIPLRNELLQEVQEKYPAIYTATKLAVLSVEDQFPSTVPDDEIGYLTLHVGAAIERKKSAGRWRRKRVVLVCGNGVGTSNFLLVQLTRAFPEIEIVGCKPAFEVQRIDPKDADLIVSTIDIHHPSIPVICIRPILHPADLQRLRFILQSSQPLSENWEEVIDQIVSEARWRGLTHPSAFRDKVRELIYQRLFAAGAEIEHLSGEDERPLLQDLLNEQSVQVVHRCSDWEEAVKIAGNMLHETGAVEERYVSAMIRAIDEHGPYMVVAPGIALVHARPEDGVREVCMSLLICREGVVFGHRDKDPVHLIFAFGAVDDHQHLRALSQLMTLLNDEGCIRQLRSSLSASEALGILKKCVKAS